MSVVNRRRPDPPAGRGTHGSVPALALLVAVVLVGAIAGCSNAGDGSDDEVRAPSTLTEVGELKQVTLTEDAEIRLDLETAVAEEARGLTVVPYAALIYDGAGDPWVYTVPEARSYLRAPVVVDSIDGDDVRISEGLRPGTEVLTVGAAEVYGSELGIEGDQ
jgi:multidrug efflux pump subunit AcrA (membrane-fusion protein)